MLIRDQRKMAIGYLDIATSKKNVKRNERRGKELNCAINPQPPTSESIQMDSSPTYSFISFTDNLDFERKSPKRVRSSTMKKYKHVKSPSVAMLCARTPVSDKIAACISSTALKDFGLISKEGASQVFNRDRIRSECSRRWEIKVTTNKTFEVIQAFSLMEKRMERYCR